MADLQYILLTSGSKWKVPEDWDASENWVFCIGPGGDGGVAGLAARAGGGGGALAYSVNLPLIAGVESDIQVGPGLDTYFGSPTTILAKKGGDADGDTPGIGGQSADCFGDHVYSGGNGGLGDVGMPYGNAVFGGGGSAPSPDGDGYDGGDGVISATGIEGFPGGGAGTREAGQDGSDASHKAGDGGAGEDESPGGVGQTFGDPNLPGAAGIDGSGGGGVLLTNYSGPSGDGGTGKLMGGPYGPGGGAAGGGYNDTIGGPAGGNGGLFGGGGGGGGGQGGLGAIIIIYRPLTTIKDIADAVRAGQPGELFHLIQINAAAVGVPGYENELSYSYAYGFGSAPFDAISLQSARAVAKRMFNFSDSGYRTMSVATGGPLVAPARLMSSVSISRMLNLSPANVSAGFSWGSAEIARRNDDFDTSEGFEGINYYSTDGAPVRFHLGWKAWDRDRSIFVDPNVNQLQQLFVGTAREFQIDRDRVTIPLRDAIFLLNKPLQGQLYSGSGGYNGDAALAGLPIPKTRGGASGYPVRNVKPVLIDATHLIYQYNDAAGTVEALYEGAAAGLTYQGDVADLYSGTTDAGKYRTDNAHGLFQLGTSATAEITCDVTGEFPNAGPITNVVQIARHLIVEDMGVPLDQVHSEAFTATAEECDYLGGVYFDPQQNWGGLDAVAFVLQSIYAQVATDQRGRIRPFLIRAYDGDQYATYTESDIITLTAEGIPDEFSPVVSRFRVRYGKNWQRQQSGFLGSATTEQQQFASGDGPVASWSDALQALRFASAKDVAIIETALLKEADAQAVADRLGALWGRARRAYAVELPVYGLESDIGNCIKLDYEIGLRPSPTYGYQYGMSYEPGTATCKIYLVV